MTIEELKARAKEINPRLSIAFYGNRYIQFRLYDVSTWHWTELGVVSSLAQADAFLSGLSAAAHVKLKAAPRVAA